MLAQHRLAIAIATAFALTTFLIGGCHKTADGPSSAELIKQSKRRQREREQNRPLDEIIADANTLIDGGNAQSARRLVRPLLLASPSDVRILTIAAACEAALGDKLVAIDMLEKIDRSDEAAYRDASWQIASLAMDVGDLPLARSRLEELVQSGSDRGAVRHKLSFVLNQLGQRLKAADALQSLLRSGDVTEKELCSLLTLHRFFVDDTLPVPSFGPDPPPHAVAVAMYHRAVGDVVKAAVLTDQLRTLHPNDPMIAAFEARIAAESHDVNQIRQSLMTAPRGIESDPNYWFAQGVLAELDSRHREAVRCYGETVKRDQTDYPAYVALERSLTIVGEKDVAKTISDRHTWLDETGRLGRSFGSRPGTEKEMARIAELMDLLQRPFEALAWRRVLAKTYGATAAESAELKNALNRLNQADPLDPRTLIGGLDLEAWPVPATVEIAEVAIEDTPVSSTPIILVDVAKSVGLKFKYENGDPTDDGSQLLHQVVGGGIGVIDFDHDGWPDLYFTQGGGDAFDATGSLPNVLFRNLGGQSFQSVIEFSGTGDQGYGQGVAIADINQDGFLDMVVANIGPNQLMINNGDGTFATYPLPSGRSQGMWTSSIACGDLSGDGLPEIVEINYVDDAKALTTPCTRDQDICNPSLFKPATDSVLTLKPDGTLAVWDGCIAMADLPNYGFGAVITNFDEKEGNDLFIANDTLFNHYWVSGPRSGDNGHSMVEAAVIHGCAAGVAGQRQGCMGVASGDFDHNGRLDLQVTNFWMQAADLYLLQTSGMFVNATAGYGLYEPTRATVGWGSQAVDFDRDGWLDLAVLNGHLIDHQFRGEPYAMRPQVFRGSRNRFDLVEIRTGQSDYWSTAALGRTMASLDWNRDGRVDLMANHLDKPAALLDNQTIGGASISFALIGTAAERDAVGAKVTVHCGKSSWTGWVTGGDGFLCTNESTVNIGIGSAGAIDRVDVLWPGGAVESFSNLRAGNRYLINEGDEVAFCLDPLP